MHLLNKQYFLSRISEYFTQENKYNYPRTRDWTEIIFTAKEICFPSLLKEQNCYCAGEMKPWRKRLCLVPRFQYDICTLQKRKKRKEMLM